jgi:glycosyltransferase involved in cell wall biosynthesis
MRRYEPALCRKFDRVYVVSDEDRKLLTSEGCGNEPALFRYGVDSDLLDIPPKRGTGFEILFFGSFMHPPNVDAARWLVKSILPAIRAQVPDARLTLAGGEAAAVEGLGREPGVTVRGWVEDLKSCLRAADVCVVPLRLGGGVKLKTLEMMASGKPVVTTRVGCEGIHAEPGVHVLLGSTAEELASHIVALLRNEDLRQFLGDNARRLMMREHRWSENLAELERDYERLVHGAGAGVSAEALGQRSAPLLPVDRLKPARRVGTA